MGQMMTFKRPDGKECSGFYAAPQGAAAAPAVVVIQEWWGLNDQIKGVADKLSAAGYRALVPDLYRGKMGLEAKEAEHLMGALDFADAASQDIRGAVNHLKASSAKVGVTGFCMGGALTVLSAVNVPEADAMVCWYGVPPLDYVDATTIQAPIMGHFAIDDAYFPIAQVDGLEQKLKEAGKEYEFFRYKAQHAFANETLVNAPIAARYDAAAASTAWTRTMEFFGRHLRS
jgi:carboxymethylenebutenolidase